MCDVAPDLPARFGVGRRGDAGRDRGVGHRHLAGRRWAAAGKGTAAQGAVVYRREVRGVSRRGGGGQVGPPPAGQATAPKLVGRDPREGFPFGQDPKLVKTVGNYWPYATTVFDYVRRTMPIHGAGVAHEQRGLRGRRVPAGAERDH